MSTSVDGAGGRSIDTTNVVNSMRSALFNTAPSRAASARAHVPAVSLRQSEAKLSPNSILAAETGRPILPVGVKEQSSTSWRYVAGFLAIFLASVGGIFFANQAYAPEMYQEGGLVSAAEAHAQGKHYAVFDLNINIRALRDEQLKRMKKAPQLILFGASHWQEAHKELLPAYDYYNAHIHRDYWEDLPGMVELLARNNKLPKKIIISIRDKQFTPVDARKDWLWEPGIPAYLAATERLGLEPTPYWKIAPWHRLQAMISLPMLFENFTRWYNAPELPGPTMSNRLETMDQVLADGSILWSHKKMSKIFTAERTLNEVNKFAAVALSSPPLVDPKGIQAFEASLDYLQSQGVKIYITHPPFNPQFYDRIGGTPYGEGLAKLETLVKDIADKRKIHIFGSFNPHVAGCTAEQYIDAEHANPTCLQKVFDQFVAIDKAAGKS